MATNDIAIERLKTGSKLFAYTRRDAIPLLAALLHCAYFFSMFFNWHCIGFLDPDLPPLGKGSGSAVLE